MMAPSARARRCGFTLVELLVVVGIIAILLAILLPSLSKARKQAQTAACLSNQRQLVAACIQYANEHNGLLPFTGFYDGPFPTWLYGNVQTMVGKQDEVQKGQLWPYLKVTGVYHCPADTGPWPNGSVNNLSTYCMNGAASAYKDNRNVGLRYILFHPDDFLFWVFSSTHTNTNGANDSTNYPQEGVTIRHSHGTTLGHMDGHADVVTGEEFNNLCHKGPSMLWCDPTAKDGGMSKGGSIPPVIPMYE
jgi:prepilin-type N-terminal cleavage/methylation domain-containing protein